MDHVEYTTPVLPRPRQGMAADSILSTESGTDLRSQARLVDGSWRTLQILVIRHLRILNSVLLAWRSDFIRVAIPGMTVFSIDWIDEGAYTTCRAHDKLW